jgi:chromosome segregation ATPase
MVDTTKNLVEECICEPYPPEAEALGCEGCAPKMYVTCDEEAVLAQMRAIKQQVRPISARLQEIEQINGGSADPETMGLEAEWEELSRQLEDLRTQWKDWEQKLDKAIERKLILLGHRPPKE